MMISIFASVLLGLTALGQPDPNSMLKGPEMPRQQQNSSPGPVADAEKMPELTALGDFGKQPISGITSTRLGRVFVSSPASAAAGPGGWLVAERKADGSLEPYPPVDPAAPLVLTSVTSIQVDAQERLWILDSANPDGKGVVRSPDYKMGYAGAAGPKLVCVELSTNKVSGCWTFSEPTTIATSLLADFRLQSNDQRTMVRGADGKEAGMEPAIKHGDTNWVYIADAGGGDAGGAILAVNINAGKVRRLFVGHPSTKAEPGFVATVGGQKLEGAAAPIGLNAHAMAMDTVNEILYWQPLGSRSLYSIRTPFIRDSGLKGEDLSKKINSLGPTVMATSMLLDGAGNLYLACPERSAIVMRAPNGSLSTFVTAPGLSWVDGISFAREPGTRKAMMWLPAPRSYGPSSPDEGYKVWAAPFAANVNPLTPK